MHQPAKSDSEDFDDVSFMDRHDQRDRLFQTSSSVTPESWFQGPNQSWQNRLWELSENSWDHSQSPITSAISYHQTCSIHHIPQIFVALSKRQASMAIECKSANRCWMRKVSAASRQLRAKLRDSDDVEQHTHTQTRFLSTCVNSSTMHHNPFQILLLRCHLLSIVV